MLKLLPTCLTILVLPILLFSCSIAHNGSQEIEANEFRTVISGVIEGSQWNDVKLAYVDTMEQRKYLTVEPDSSESFHFLLNPAWPGEFTLYVQNNRFDGVYFPGDSIHIRGELKGYNDDFIGNLSFSGNGANTFVYFKNKALNPGYIDIQEAFFDAKRASYSRFAEVLDSLYLERLKLFNVDTVGTNLPEHVAHYVLAGIKYRYLEDRLVEPVLRLHLSYDSTQVPADYYNFIESILVNDNTAYNNRLYYQFLHSLSYQLSIPETLPIYPILDRLSIITKTGFRMADSTLTGKAKEFFLSKSIYGFLRVDIDVADSLIDQLETRGIHNFLLDKYSFVVDSIRNVTITIPESLQVFTLDEKPVNLLDTIKTMAYVGVWSVGCRGCLMDFQGKERLLSDYKNSGLQFISIAITKNKDEVKDYVSRFDDTGIHLLDQSGVVEQVLNIHGIPKYFLIDESGNVVKHNFFRPGDPKLITYIEQNFIGK